MCDAIASERADISLDAFETPLRRFFGANILDLSSRQALVWDKCRLRWPLEVNRNLVSISAPGQNDQRSASGHKSRSVLCGSLPHRRYN